MAGKLSKLVTIQRAAATAGLLVPYLQAAAATPPAAGDAPLEEIVVTAQKRQESLQDVPISVTVLTGQQLDNQSVGGVTEALRAVPGVSITSTAQGGATQLTIRGVAAAGATLSGSSTTAYYIDSVPFGLVKTAILPDTNAYDLARIEVLRGPQGTLYGANALNGVVRVLTNDANLRDVEFKARGIYATTEGGDPTYRADAAVNFPLMQDKLGLRIVAGFENAGGWIDQPARGVDDANSQDSNYVRVKFNAKPTENLSVGLSAWISRIDQDAPNYADDDGNQSSPVALPQTLDFDAYSLNLGYNLPGVTISSATSYLTFSNTSQRDYTFLGAGQRLYTDIDSKVFTEELLASSDDDGLWRWSAGAMYRDASDVLYQTLFVLPAPIDFGDDSRSYAIFGEVTRKFADDTFELTGGLRYFNDEVSQTERSPSSGNPDQALAHRTETFDAVTPRVVLTWLPSDRFTGYASFSEGFRSGFNQSPLVITAAPDLPSVDADKLYNYEVGSRGSTSGGGLSFDVAVYYIKWDDIQQNLRVPYNGAFLGASVNGPSASGVGFDIGLTARPADGLELGINYTWNGLELDEDVVSNGVVLFNQGDRLSYSPEQTANAFGRYSFTLGGNLEAELGASVSYVSKIPARALVGGVSTLFESDAPLIADVTFSLRGQNHWEAMLFVDNLTNDDSVLQPPSDPSFEMRPRPRTYGLQLQYHF